MSKVFKLSDISHLITKGTTPTTVGGSFVDSGINFIKIESIGNDGTLDSNKFAFIDEKSNLLLKRSILKKDDVLFSIAGAIGRSTIIDEQVLPANTNQALAIIRPIKEFITPKYLYYSTKTPSFQNQAYGRINQTAQANVNLAQLSSIELSVPLLATQKRVTDILSAYDDLIDNNRKRMALLEKAARMLYEEWFLHLQFPGHEHTPVVAGVPEGWESGTVSSFFTTASGGTPSRAKEVYYTGTYNWVKTKELNNDFIFDTEEKITEEAIKNSAAKLFPKQTILIAMYGATVGELGILATEAATNQACCAILPTEGIGYAYPYLFFLSQKEKLISLSMGAAQKNVSQQIIRSMSMVLPKAGVLSVFNATIEPVFEQLRVLQIQNQKLQQARDLLLPRLMSGELAV